MEDKLSECDFLSEDMFDEIIGLIAIFDDELKVKIHLSNVLLEIEILPCENEDKLDDQNIRISFILQFKISEKEKLYFIRHCKGFYYKYSVKVSLSWIFFKLQGF
jgi:hypothetical protein